MVRGGFGLRFPGRPSVSPAVAALFAARVLKPGDRVLDVACGRGTDSLALARWGARVVGVDAAPEATAYARRKARAAGVARRAAFVTGSAFELPRVLAEEAPFDAALDTLFLNNLERREFAPYAKSLAAVLRPGGLVVFQTKLARLADPVAPPRAFSRAFDFGPTTATLIPERPLRVGGEREWIPVAISVGVRR